MQAAESTSTFICPKCNTEQVPDDGPAQDRETICVNCNWHGNVELFFPLPLSVEQAEEALPDDAACAHHPDKRAVATCAGTGDYVCSLCTVDLDGETYSAQYLAASGKKISSKRFDRYLKRPDSEVQLFLLLCFVPGVNYLWWPASPIWIPMALFRIAKAFRLRKEDPLYAKVVSRTSLVVTSVVLALILCLAIFLVFAIFLAIAEEL